MSDHVFTLAGVELAARASGALYWPEQNLLCVSDLHLGMSPANFQDRLQPSAPYETQETLERLDHELEATQATTVICLGDSFADTANTAVLQTNEKLWISRMQAGRRWVWIGGSHSAGPVDLGGTHLASLPLAPLTFCAVADRAQAGEVSGYYHPKTTQQEQGRKVTRPCFLYDSDRLIMPAFGIYSGGLRNNEAPLAALMRAEAVAIPTGSAKAAS